MPFSGNGQNNGDEQPPREPPPATPDVIQEGRPPPATPELITKMIIDSGEPAAPPTETKGDEDSNESG